MDKNFLHELASVNPDCFSPKDGGRLLNVSWDKALEICQQGEADGVWRRRTGHGYFYALNEPREN